MENKIENHCSNCGHYTLQKMKGKPKARPRTHNLWYCKRCGYRVIRKKGRSEET